MFSANFHQRLSRTPYQLKGSRKVHVRGLKCVVSGVHPHRHFCSFLRCVFLSAVASTDRFFVSQYYHCLEHKFELHNNAQKEVKLNALLGYLLFIFYSRRGSIPPSGGRRRKRSLKPASRRAPPIYLTKYGNENTSQMSYRNQEALRRCKAGCSS